MQTFLILAQAKHNWKGWLVEKKNKLCFIASQKWLLHYNYLHFSFLFKFSKILLVHSAQQIILILWLGKAQKKVKNFPNQTNLKIVKD